MALLTVDEVRENVETQLTDPALQRLIEAEDEAITYQHGEIGTQVEEVEANGLTKVIYPRRRVASIDKVTEKDKRAGTETVLSADDYELVAGGMRIDRLPTGTNPQTYWQHTVRVEYTPYDDTKTRKAVLIDLVKLAVQWAGTDAESLPDYSSTREREYQLQREAILARLGGRRWA
jgi:hypothetical protein